MTSSALRALALTGALLCTLSAPAQTGKTLRWAATNDVLTLDPHSQDHGTTTGILLHAYEGLTRYSAKREIEPALAESWKELSPTQVRFQLRKGVKFHDGSPFSADDVVFSFQRISAPTSTLQAFVAGVKEVKKVDAHTVDFLLEAPNPILTRTIIDFRIMSRAWAEKNKALSPPNYAAKEETFATRNVNGTGPYRITGWQPDQKITMVQNKDWWDAKHASNVAEVVYTPIKSDQTRVAALLSGEVDLMTAVPTQDVERLRQQPQLKVLDGNEVRTIFIAMDQGSDEIKGASVKGANPFKDKRVREALSIAIDRIGIQKAIMRGLSIPGSLMVAPGVHGYEAQLDTPFKPDLERARKLLAEAGYANGFEVPFHCPNNRYVNDEPICVAIAGMWAKIGVKAKLQTENFSVYSPKVQKFEYPLFLFGWGVNTFDALYSAQSLFRTRAGGADGNWNWWRLSDPRLDALIDDIKTETQLTKRDALIRAVLTRVRDEHYFIPLHHQMKPWVMRKGVDTVHRSDDKPEVRFTVLK